MIWLDARVQTSDGAGVGKVSRLLVHPSSWKVLAVAVRNGIPLLAKERCLLPEAIKGSSPQSVVLNIDLTTFEHLPMVRGDEWQRPPRQWLTPLGWRADRIYWPAGYGGPVSPEISTDQLRHWGTLRASGWARPPRLPQPVEHHSAPEQSLLPCLEGRHFAMPAMSRLEVELARERRGESLLDVDPYDVLARPSESGFKTGFERDDASMINPQPRPWV